MVVIQLLKALDSIQRVRNQQQMVHIKHFSLDDSSANSITNSLTIISAIREPSHSDSACKFSYCVLCAFIALCLVIHLSTDWPVHTAESQKISIPSMKRSYKWSITNIIIHFM
jgi:hypothetical protein